MKVSFIIFKYACLAYVKPWARSEHHVNQSMRMRAYNPAPVKQKQEDQKCKVHLQLHTESRPAQNVEILSKKPNEKTTKRKTRLGQDLTPISPKSNPKFFFNCNILSMQKTMYLYKICDLAINPQGVLLTSIAHY